MPRKSSKVTRAIVVRERNGDHRVALPPNERKLSFGDRWSYAPAPETHSYIQIKKRYPTEESEREYSRAEIPIGRFGEGHRY
jgi:hypothetical protein